MDSLVKELMSEVFWSSDENLVLSSPQSLEEKAEMELWLSEQSALNGHVFFQTSGSTGSPKWVALSKRALLTSAKMVNAHLGVKNDTKWLVSIPLYHVGGLGVVARAYACAGLVFLYDKKWNPVTFVAELQRLEINYASLVPAQVVDIVRGKLIPPSSLECIVVGGGYLSNEVYAAAIDLGWPLVRSYGMSEAASQIATGDEGDYWLQILQGWETALTESGLLKLRGAASFSGYVVKATDGYVFEKPFDAEGWFITQDEVQLKDGRLHFVSRSGRTVKILGELVDLSELEKEMHKEIGRDLVVIPVPDERKGTQLAVVVEGMPVKTPQHWERGLKAVSEVRFMESFPRSPLKKVLRAKVEDWFQERFAGDK